VRPEWNVIMDSDVEELLREGMGRFTRDVRAPAGLVQRAARRRRRRWAVHIMAGGATAMTAAAVAVAAVVVPAAPGLRGSVVETAYVVHRVNRALDAAQPGEMAQMKITTVSAGAPGGAATTTTTEEWSYGDQWRSITSSAGRTLYDEGSSASSVYTLVSYLKRTWARALEPAPPAFSVSGPVSCGTVAALPLLFRFGLPGVGSIASALPATVVKDLRNAISCGDFRAAGRQRVDGIEAIRLTSRPGSPLSETIWVNPGTDLPVRVEVTGPNPDKLVPAPSQGPAGLAAPPNTPAQSPTGISHSFPRQEADITWLRPTAQNLARLTVPVPAGFRRVPVGNVVAPILLGGPQVLCLGPDGPTCKGARSRLRPLPSPSGQS
jgi:hypothetical protein